MRVRAIGLSLLAFLFASISVFAQDWADDLTDAPKALDAKFIPANHKHLTMTEAKALVEETIQKQDGPTLHYVDDPSFYCIIHLVDWKTDSPAVSATSWYVFRGGKQWNAVELEAARIYGSRKVAVLYVHLVPQFVDPTEAQINAYASSVSKDVTTVKSEYASGKMDLGIEDSHHQKLVRINGLPFVAGYPPNLNLDYRIEVTKKDTAPLSHLIMLLSGAAQAGNGNILVLDTKTTAISAAKLYDIQYKTSDILVKAQFGPSSQELDKKTLDDEGNYHFDFSAGIPVNGIKQLQYDATNDTATPKSVTTTNAYGLVNYFVRPVDVKTNYTVWPPSLVAGVGLTGHPSDKPLVGLGFGYGKLSGFIGCVFNKVTQPATAAGKTNSDREEKLVFGINLTARQVADLLGKKK